METEIKICMQQHFISVNVGACHLWFASLTILCSEPQHQWWYYRRKPGINQSRWWCWGREWSYCMFVFISLSLHRVSITAYAHLFNYIKRLLSEADFMLITAEILLSFLKTFSICPCCTSAVIACNADQKMSYKFMLDSFRWLIRLTGA